MMQIIVAPSLNKWSGGSSTLFLAGGITGCPDWQTDLLRLLADTDLVVFNPRRKDFPIGDPNAALEQIAWEHHVLRQADIISFWFPKETLCPITLYELGAWSMTQKPLCVGMHPEYQRRQDVEIQTALARADISIVYDLVQLAGSIIQLASWSILNSKTSK